MKKVNLKKLSRKKLNRRLRRTIILFLTKLGYTNATVAKKLTIANRIVTYMTGNAAFPTPTPTLASITTLINNLTAAEAALDGSKIKTEQRDLALAALIAAMKELQAYVELTANGNVEMILSSGFEVRNPRTAPAIPTPPVGLTADNTAIEQQVKLRWKPVKGSKLYIVEVTTDIDGVKWDFAAQSTKASVLVNDLNSGVRYFFRVTAINAAGVSGWSEIAECRPN